MTEDMRLLLIQFGDYHAALEARTAGEPETYRAQYYSLDAVDGFIGNGSCTVVCLDLPEQDRRHGAYRIIGGRFMPASSGFAHMIHTQTSARRLVSIAEETNPTHIIVRTPGWVLRCMGTWALRNGVPLLPILADYFPKGSFLHRMRRLKEIRIMNSPQIPLITNHNYPACHTLADAGVQAAKVVPWDWPAVRHPDESPVKNRTGAASPFRILYAGLLLHAKGVGDLIQAAALSVREHPDLVVDICGDGPDRQQLEQQVQESGLARHVHFHGKVPNITVLALMQQADAVAVPSRPTYPEGLPNVIYEALETRTPLLAANHPSFMGRLHDDNGCLLFPCGDATALARTISRIRQPELYARLSAGTLEAWEGIQCPVTFGELIMQWRQWTVDGGPIPCLQHSLQPDSGQGVR
ncbi:glycosyltransferase family 4 protein [Desulfovibrio subterraneus]|uniref:BRCT domain-containing protein n=1 Tax=Desulfovibrio subterraneus TaxID=2718620 RepID=A0A7J0BMM6_9BACT|nr:glycosyltransferase family 4 protein [Desulfovibrio subterraneus]GFM34471.1 hypothetical protein DSM101010T_28360 [Desulfovibrio subterraneus]